MRHPARSIERQKMMDFDEFVEAFSRLSVGEGGVRLLKRKLDDTQESMKAQRAQTPLRKPYHSAATLFIATRQLPAPLPALIRSNASPVHTPQVPITTSSCPLSKLAPQSPAVPLERTKRRKISALPSHASAGLRREPRYVSRMSSFGSDCSSQTPPSSGSSAPSSTLVTPESSPTTLPTHLTQLPILECYDLQNSNDVTKDFVRKSISFPEGSQFDLSSINSYDGAGGRTPIPLHNNR
jgi:hypothetical protein